MQVMENTQLPEYTRDEVAKHNTPEDLWCIVDDKVYDLTRFARLHPGGKAALYDVAGKDATVAFYGLHRKEVLGKTGKRLVIGKVVGGKAAAAAEPGAVSVVPYGEQSAFMAGWKSAYYKESHFRFQRAIREFFDREVVPTAAMMEESNEDPSQEIFKKMGAAGILAARIGPGKWLKGLNLTLPAGLPVDEFDHFHELIAHQEVARIGHPGLADGLGSGMVIGLPPVLHFGKQHIAQKVAGEVLRGEKRICLAISEAQAGSDVANITTTAELSPCGKFYIVNGLKKWITNGNFSDYFVTAVRTGGPGIGGISLLLAERSEGLTTRKIKTSYGGSAGTCWVFYDNVKVPVENLLGKENGGFKCIMANFNHERWLIACMTNRSSRLCLEESFKWANQRRVFGAELIRQPVIRNKLAHMVSMVESAENWLENITFQMNSMDYKTQSEKLAGPIALLKLFCTRTFNSIVDDACQIFGGRALTRTGMGRIVEAAQRSVKFSAILGGSEEIMADLGIKQTMRNFPDARL